jgi:hypothetical protein
MLEGGDLVLFCYMIYRAHSSRVRTGDEDIDMRIE